MLHSLGSVGAPSFIILTRGLPSRYETNYSFPLQLVTLVPVDGCHVDVFRDNFLTELGKFQKERQ